MLRTCSLFVTVAAGASALLAPVAVVAQAASLPKPYVSRALKATVMPIDDAVRAQFKLAPTATGVIVVSTQPGGVAE